MASESIFTQNSSLKIKVASWFSRGSHTPSRPWEYFDSLALFQRCFMGSSMLPNHRQPVPKCMHQYGTWKWNFPKIVCSWMFLFRNPRYIETQKGVITIQRCSVENQKGVVVQTLWRQRTSGSLRKLLNSINALLVLSRRYIIVKCEFHVLFSMLYILPEWSLVWRIKKFLTSAILVFGYTKLLYSWLLYRSIWTLSYNKDLKVRFLNRASTMSKSLRMHLHHFLSTQRCSLGSSMVRNRPPRVPKISDHSGSLIWNFPKIVCF